MPSNRKPKVQEDAPSASLVSMLSLLHERCPVLCPSVIPSGLADGEHGVALLALCEDVAEKQALASLLQAARGSVGSCALTAREVDNAELRFVSLWELQPVSDTTSQSVSLTSYLLPVIILFRLIRVIEFHL